MKKVTINIDGTKPIPSWAKNFLKQNSLLQYLQIVKKTKRKIAIPMIQETEEFAFSADCLEANARGEIVFKWPTPQEQSLFILKWS